MANFSVETTPDERAKVLYTLTQIKGATVPVSKIAAMSGLTHSRTRYALIDLADMGYIKRNVSKAYNAHYVRYSYEVIK